MRLILGADHVDARFPKWWPILLIPVAISCVPWVFWVASIGTSNGSDLEGAIFSAAIFGIVSFLLTGPIAAAQLELAPKPRLSLKAYAILYYAISGPTLLFQAIVHQSSSLWSFIPGSVLASNMLRTIALTGILGIVLYAICATLTVFVIRVIGNKSSVG